ncbi:MAG: Asp23/Gls24 family envelope stress response protein, partial [Oscillospiraceae bacterium]|nr:Asp23/Gls24 family envelope stress response protein [Oscillospiraceae bacterium]
DIIALVALNAAAETDGVAEPTAILGKGTAEERRRNAQHINVCFSDGEAVINLSIAVLIGKRIPEVAAAVQSAVSSAVQVACGVKPKQVNVRVTRVRFE